MNYYNYLISLFETNLFKAMLSVVYKSADRIPHHGCNRVIHRWEIIVTSRILIAYAQFLRYEIFYVIRKNFTQRHH